MRDSKSAFFRFSEKDQFNLLMSNTKMLQILRMADFFKPGQDITDQMCFVMFETPSKDMLPKDLPPLPPLNISAFAGLFGEKSIELFEQIRSIQMLEMDPTTLVLTLVLALLSTPDQAENPDLMMNMQYNLRRLIYRYLCTKMSKAAALCKVERIEIVLNTLMASEDMISNPRGLSRSSF